MSEDGSSLPKRRLLVAIIEIDDDDALASLRQDLPEAALFELCGSPSDLSASAQKVVVGLTKLEASLGGETQVRPVPPPLSRRQQQILAMIAQGLTNKTIARELNLSPFTVRNHVALLYRMLKVKTRLEALLVAQKLDIKTIGPSTSPGHP